MAGETRLAAFVCVVFGAWYAATPSGAFAQALSTSSVQGSSGNTLSSPPPVSSPAQASPEQTPPVYPQTADGFNAEMAGALEAYRNGDAAAGRRLLEQFRLLRSAEWLAEFVGPEQSETLAKRYDREFESYVKSTEASLEDLASAKGRKLNTKFKPGTTGAPSLGLHAGPLKLSGIVAVKEPVCFSADFSAALTGKADLALKGNAKFTMWEDTFVYQDGAFRFIGRGAWPFWVWEDRSEGKAP